jgi:hypothetical protein
MPDPILEKILRAIREGLDNDRLSPYLENNSNVPGSGTLVSGFSIDIDLGKDINDPKIIQKLEEAFGKISSLMTISPYAEKIDREAKFDISRVNIVPGDEKGQYFISMTIGNLQPSIEGKYFTDLFQDAFSKLDPTYNDLTQIGNAFTGLDRQNTAPIDQAMAKLPKP